MSIHLFKLIISKICSCLFFYLNLPTAPRQVFFYHNGALLQSRLYTCDTGVAYGGANVAEEHWEYPVFLKLIQDEICKCTGGDDDWLTEDYRGEESVYDRRTDEYKDIHGYNGDNFHGLKLNSFGVEVYRGDEFGGYIDWEKFANQPKMIRISVRQHKLKRGRWGGKNGLEMYAGESGLSIRDGRELYSGEYIPA